MFIHFIQDIGTHPEFPSSNKTDLLDTTEILFKVVLNTNKVILMYVKCTRISTNIYALYYVDRNDVVTYFWSENMI